MEQGAGSMGHGERRPENGNRKKETGERKTGNGGNSGPEDRIFPIISIYFNQFQNMLL
jgi:hypothetical protein